MLATAPITDSSCREKLHRAQNRESFRFCSLPCTNTVKVWGSHAGLQEPLGPYWEPGTALGALNPCREGLSWAWSCPCIPLLSPLAQTSVCVQFACVLWRIWQEAGHMPSSLELPAEWSTAEPAPSLSTWGCFCLKLQDHRTGALVWVMSVGSCSETAELQ